MVDNIFDDIPDEAPEEIVTALLSRPGVRIERIVSTGQSSDWMTQAWDEWVLLVTGSAGLLIADEPELILSAGDCLLIAANTRHRVAWTDPDQPTVWLAVHLGG
ncbi:cupin 2 domain-containing protein [Caulobacter ginsengisoli]|uniref:Cupin 2 domain-containing protein n=1 Tax=Caulobacter ginsengisoli TaxID=400775 RepID=A0ABU0IQT1_9CAUL|nr:cupin domain-containing protein [Caulobacter ginsengisoli]MDQ0463379.1 cupin 2 domain-containing protein [Caulobacter ginsengisoli]